MTFSPPLCQNATFHPKPRAEKHNSFTPLSVRTLRLPQASSSEAWLFYTPSRSECYCSPQALSWEALLSHTPLSHKATFYLKHRAPKQDFFTAPSVRMLLFISSPELRSITFSHPSHSKCYLCASSLELRSMIFSHPSWSECHCSPQALRWEALLSYTPQSECCFLHHASSSEA